VGNVKAAVGYHGRSGCCAGIDQILFTVPSGVEGCFVPVVVKIGNMVSNSVTMSVASGTVCSDPIGFSTAELQTAQSGDGMTIADIGLQRFTGTFSLPGMGTLQGTVDLGEGHFRRYQPDAVLGSARGIAVGFLEGYPSAGFSFHSEAGVVRQYWPRGQRPGVEAGDRRRLGTEHHGPGG
jgi:hypothetical protein